MVGVRCEVRGGRWRLVIHVWGGRSRAGLMREAIRTYACHLHEGEKTPFTPQDAFTDKFITSAKHGCAASLH